MSLKMSTDTISREHFLVADCLCGEIQDKNMKNLKYLWRTLCFNKTAVCMPISKERETRATFIQVSAALCPWIFTYKNFNTNIYKTIQTRWQLNHLHGQMSSLHCMDVIRSFITESHDYKLTMSLPLVEKCPMNS